MGSPIPTFFAINYLQESLEQGGIDSSGGWRIVFDAMRHFFKTMRTIRFYFRDDAVCAIGEAIKVDHIVVGSGKMNL
jgi:hypothetical protein